MSEWPVLIFVIFMQAAIGIVVLSFIQGLILQTHMSDDSFFKVTQYQLLLAAVFAGIGFVASFWHLGYAWNAPNALRHLSTSWMSREILATSIFIGLLCVTIFWGAWQKHIPLALVAALALAGLINLYCMGSLYRATTVVSWVSAYTHVTFFGSALILGAIFSYFMLLQSGITLEANIMPLRKIAILTLILVCAGLALQALAYPSLVETMSKFAQDGVVTYPHNPVAAQAGLELFKVLRWLLAIIAVGVLVCLLYNQTYHGTTAYGVILFAALLLFSAESMERYTFFLIG